MKWGEGRDVDDVIPLVAREEAANSMNEGYEGVKIDLQWGPVTELWSPTRNWVTWRGAVHISPGGQIRGMSGTAEEVGHRLVGGAAIGTGGVTVGLKPRAMARTKLGEGAAV